MIVKHYVNYTDINIAPVSREEQETTISFTRESELMLVETNDRTLITKLANMMQRDPDHYKCFYYSSNVSDNGKPFVYTFECPKKLLTFRAERMPSQKESQQEAAE